MTAQTTSHPIPMVVTDFIEDYLLVWILFSVVLGIAMPAIAVVTRASTVILAMMIGSISLTLSVKQFRQIRARTLGLVLVGPRNEFSPVPVMPYSGGGEGPEMPEKDR